MRQLLPGQASPCSLKTWVCAGTHLRQPLNLALHWVPQQHSPQAFCLGPAPTVLPVGGCWPGHRLHSSAGGWATLGGREWPLLGKAALSTGVPTPAWPRGKGPLQQRLLYQEAVSPLCAGQSPAEDCPFLLQTQCVCSALVCVTCHVTLGPPLLYLSLVGRDGSFCCSTEGCVRTMAQVSCVRVLLLPAAPDDRALPRLSEGSAALSGSARRFLWQL